MIYEDTYRAQQWNELVQVWIDLQGTWELPADAEVQRLVEKVETEYYEPRDESSGRFEDQMLNDAIALKWAIRNALAAKLDLLRVPAGYAAGLDWDDIRPFLDWIANAGLLAVRYQEGLSGGHGAGTEWWVTPPGGDAIHGSIPTSAHGRSDGALNGTRGTLGEVAAAQNAAVDAVIAGIAWPALVA